MQVFMTVIIGALSADVVLVFICFF